MAHGFPLKVSWSGSTATRSFTRAAEASAPGKPVIELSSGDPASGGDMTRWNPEDLLGASLSMCHMLTFLALAAKVGLDVRGYEGDAEAVLDTVDRVTSVTKVVLRPRVTLAPGSNVAKATEMFHKAHKYCYIANSVRAETVMEPVFVEG